MGEGDESGGEDDAGDALLIAMGERMRKLREAAGMSFGELAEAAGVSRGYIYRAEAGKQNATIRSLARIAIALSTSLSSLLEGVDADQVAVGKRAYTWRDGTDPRDPDRPLGNRRERAKKGDQG